MTIESLYKIGQSLLYIKDKEIKSLEVTEIQYSATEHLNMSNGKIDTTINISYILSDGKRYSEKEIEKRFFLSSKDLLNYFTIHCSI